jgi:hypothetical protein
MKHSNPNAKTPIIAKRFSSRQKHCVVMSRSEVTLRMAIAVKNVSNLVDNTPLATHDLPPLRHGAYLQAKTVEL